MANFFQSPQIQQTPNPEPPGYNLIRQMMLQRLMQQFTNPYGMSPGGMANWQGFNTGSKPFDPTGGFSSQGGSPGYNYLTNQGMPGMGGPGGGTYQSGSQSLGNGPRTMSGGGMGSNMPSTGPGQNIGGMTPSGSGGTVAGLLQALLGGGGGGGVSGSFAGGAMPPGMQMAPITMQQGAPMVSPNPSPRNTTGASLQNLGSGARSTMPTQPSTSGYDGNVMGYGGNSQPSALMGYGGSMYGAPQSHGAMPHLLGLLRMAHTQPRGSMGPRPANGMAMPMPMGRRR